MYFHQTLFSVLFRLFDSVSLDSSARGKAIAIVTALDCVFFLNAIDFFLAHFFGKHFSETIEIITMCLLLGIKNAYFLGNMPIEQSSHTKLTKTMFILSLSLVIFSSSYWFYVTRG
jgi:hypothetical protein